MLIYDTYIVDIPVHEVPAEVWDALAVFRNAESLLNDAKAVRAAASQATRDAPTQDQAALTAAIKAGKDATKVDVQHFRDKAGKGLFLADATVKAREQLAEEAHAKLRSVMAEHRVAWMEALDATYATARHKAMVQVHQALDALEDVDARLRAWQWMADPESSYRHVGQMPSSNQPIQKLRSEVERTLRKLPDELAERGTTDFMPATVVPGVDHFVASTDQSVLVPD